MGNKNYTEERQEILTTIIRVTGCTSFLCSLLIVYTILKDAKNKLPHIYQRLVLCLSLTDMVSSINLAQNGWVQDYAGTCSASAFLFQFGVAAMLYTACLCWHFLLVICYEWTPRRFKESRIELCMHLMALGWPLSVGVVALATQSYGVITIINGFCHFDEFRNGTDAGRHAGRIPFYLEVTGFFAPMIFASAVILYSMIRICCTVRGQEKRQQSYEFQNQVGSARRSSFSIAQHRSSFQRTKQAVVQASLFIAGFVVTNITFFTAFILHAVFLTGNPNEAYLDEIFAWAVAVYIFMPLQGMWNLIGTCMYCVTLYFNNNAPRSVFSCELGR